jgi:hypothetical protein
MDDTLTTELSTLSGVLEQDSMLTQELSAVPSLLEQEIRSTIQSVLSSLQEVQSKIGIPEGVPVHPYERLKHEYVTSRGLEFYSHEDIEHDSEKEPHHYFDAIKEISDCKNQRILDHLDFISTGVQHEHAGNVFASVSGDDITLNQDHAASHLQFIEMLKNIPLSAVEANPISIANKILSKYTETYHPTSWT